MNRLRIERTIKRIAYQIAEKVKGKKICLVGLNERGYAVASEINQILSETHQSKLASLYIENAESDAEKIKSQVDFRDTILFLVDDVIFTGKTMFSALQHLLDQPDYPVYITVLIDRGNRHLPVKAEFTGMEIPTKPNEHVEMTLENGVAEEVFLYRYI